jgi:hypothetical protein
MSVRYCGRDFSAAEIERIRRCMAARPQANRSALSRMVCEELDWRRADGRLKDMSCRVAMLRMEADGLIVLPPPQKRNANGQPYRRRTEAAEPDLFPVLEPVHTLSDLHLELVQGRPASHLWNEYIDRYHYLGYRPLGGDQLRYFARSGHRVLGVLGFAAAAWKTAVRDEFIGWNAPQRQSRLHLVVNNARFLILPWVRSQNLASCLLSMASKHLAEDWQTRYGYRPVLLETFVETPRFRGTCYKAANWLELGRTRGRGKWDVRNIAPLPTKIVWVYPLSANFRRLLCG